MIPIRVFQIPCFDFLEYVQLKRNSVSIISDDCWEGNVYNYLGLRFDSPFINFFINNNDFIKMISNFENYIEKIQINKGEIHIMDKKRILMVSGMSFFPPDQGNRRRIYNFIKLIQNKGYVVDYLYYSYRRSETEIEMCKCLGEGQLIYCSLKHDNPDMWNSKWNMLGRFAPPDKTDSFYEPDVARKVNTVMKKRQYSILWLEYMIQSKIFEAIEMPVVKVIDTHDSFAYRNFRLYPYAHSNVGYSVTYGGERKALGRADYVIAIQKLEEVYFNKLLNGKKTKVVTIGDNHTIVRNVLNNTHDICFVGSINKLNIDGINWFINQVFPLIIHRIKDCRLLIAGRICEAIHVRNKNIKCLGCVDKLEELYRNCRIVINPVRGGTGLNIKSIEAVAHCKPIVATAAGARGLGFHKPIVVIADNELEFAENVCNYLQSDELCQEYINNCYEYINAYNRRNIKSLDKILEVN